MQGTLCCLIA